MKIVDTNFKKCCYFYPNNFKFCAFKKNYKSKLKKKISVRDENANEVSKNEASNYSKHMSFSFPPTM